MYRVNHLLRDLGWVDLDLGCLTGRWAVLQLWCCPSKTVEHPKSKSTQPSPRGDGSPCIVFAKFLQIEHVSVRSLQICDHMIAHIWYVMNYKCITESDWRLTSFLPNLLNMAEEICWKMAIYFC